MKLREIEDQLELAKVYRYVANLEIEKAKRQRHNMLDIDDFYIHKVKEYDAVIGDLYQLRVRKVASMLAASAIGVNAIILIVFLFSLTF